MRPEGIIAKWMSMPWALNGRNFDVGLQRLMSIDYTPGQAIKALRFARKANDVRQVVVHDDDGAIAEAVEAMQNAGGELSPVAIGPGGDPVEQRRRQNGYQLVGGTSIGLLRISGLLMKEVPECFGFFSGEEAVSTEELRMSLDAMLSDDQVKTILLEIDSPGGQVAGTQELGDAIVLASEEKPVVAAIRDLAASGAYWLASQASEVTANHTAFIGSIGVYMVVDDMSRMFDKAGITTHVISSGGVKGAGVQGAPVSDDAINIWREEVVALKDIFVKVVANGREMPEAAVQALATGRTWLADEAKSLGLVDRVENFDETLTRIARAE